MSDSGLVQTADHVNAPAHAQPEQILARSQLRMYQARLRLAAPGLDARLPRVGCETHLAQLRPRAGLSAADIPTYVICRLVHRPVV